MENGNNNWNKKKREKSENELKIRRDGKALLKKIKEKRCKNVDGLSLEKRVRENDGKREK